MKVVRDVYGRNFKTLRVSLINTCNLGCVYCACGQDETRDNYALQQSAALPASEMLAIIARLHGQLGLRTLRLTGGEPLLYKELELIVRGAVQMGIEDLALTTNGLLLEQQAEGLKKAGLQSINVSLDAIDEAGFFKISRRRGLQKILNGIDKALECGLWVKINTVIMRGINEDQILPLLDYAFDRQLKIRFLEIMAMGHLHENPEQYFFSQQEMLSLIESRHRIVPLPRELSATANYWATDAGKVFGVIANESAPFCGDCDRLRLDSFGNIYGCLSSNTPISLLDVREGTALEEKLQEAMAQKQTLKFTGSELSMMHIGG
ncbi:MAG: GTP 3',8-cyclase MoaA [Bacteroidota bacterium]